MSLPDISHIFPSQIGGFCDIARKVNIQVSSALRMEPISNETALDVSSRIYGYSCYEELLSGSFKLANQDTYTKIDISYKLVFSLVSEFVDFHNAKSFANPMLITRQLQKEYELSFGDDMVASAKAWLASKADQPKNIASRVTTERHLSEWCNPTLQPPKELDSKAFHTDELNMFLSMGEDVLIHPSKMQFNSKKKHPTVTIDTSELSREKRKLFFEHPVVSNFVDNSNEKNVTLLLVDQSSKSFGYSNDNIKVHFDLECIFDIDGKTKVFLTEFKKDMLTLSITDSVFITFNDSNGYCKPCTQDDKSDSMLSRLILKEMDSLFLKLNKEKLILNSDFRKLVGEHKYA